MKKIIAVDVNALPEEYQNEPSTYDIIAKYKIDFGLEDYTILPFDTRKRNKTNTPFILM